MEKLRRMVRSSRPIILNMRLVKILDMDDLRDLFEAIHQWGYNRDFTYRDGQARSSVQQYLRRWLRETYLQ